MVPILVLLTFAAFLLIGFVVQRRRATTEGPSRDGALRVMPAAVPAPRAEPAFYLHPGHVWVRLAPDGHALVGASDFAANFIGALSRLEMPREGAHLRQGQPAWTLVSARQRRLTQVMPVEGDILAVNRDLVSDLGLLQRSPRHEGWILRVRPTRLGESLRSLFSGALAETWKEIAGYRLNSLLSPALGRLANDGGVWVANFGDKLEDSVWLEMRRDLFPPDSGEATT
ncbi:MAG TPA: glycine cleavage system protein H [Candidatus Eisenbacteria bacterium]|jgi:glycine cleavage system H protein